MSQPLTRRSVLRAGLVGGVALGAAGWSPTRRVLSSGSGVPTTPVQLARVRLDASFAPFVGAFDTTEHVHDGMVDVMLWPGDRKRLDETGAGYDIVVDDWHAQFLAERRAEHRLADGMRGDNARRDGYEDRTMYRVLADYVAEMDALAELYPKAARRLTLTPDTWQGRALEVLVIGGNVARAEVDGRPQAMMCGLHHAREWPSGEFTMNFAHDLLHGHAAGDATLKPLVDGLCIYVIPVSNPDGFVRSREWLPVAQADVLWSTGVDLGLIVAEDGPGKRRNLRDNGSGTSAPVANDIGVDTNRNYPVMWGGVGASPSPTSQLYHGPNPGSEPEVQAMLSLLRRTQLIAGISNHTSGNLMLRPWGHTPIDAPDEDLLADLGGRMADDIGYTNGSWNEALYPGTGIWDDWLYGIQGTLAYTMEHFTFEETGNYAPFHPVYAAFLQERYQAIRPSYVAMLEAAFDTSTHGVLRGEAPAGTVVTLAKDVEFPYAAVDPDSGDDFGVERLRAELVVGGSRKFAWHVNPSGARITLAEFGEGTEPYLVTATLPDGSVRKTQVRVERGETIDLRL